MKSLWSYIKWFVGKVWAYITIPFLTFLSRKYLIRSVLWFIFTVGLSLIGTIANIIKVAFLNISRIDEKYTFWDRVDYSVSQDCKSGTFYTFAIVLVASMLYPLFEGFLKHEFYMHDSKSNHIIQIADIISGSLAYNFDEKKKTKNEGHDYLELLKKYQKVIGVTIFPYSYDTYSVESRPEDENFEHIIASTCYRRAISFIKQNENKVDEEVKMQVVTLKYLLFRFANNKFRTFIPTKELKANLADRGFGHIDTLKFRTRIIGKLRDANVIISSNSKGYKIPATKAELFDYVNLEQSIVVPILGRLKKCRDLLFEGTEGNFDLFEKDEYKLLKKITQDNIS